ncbi:MAG: FtsX-like permease family protein, partial [Butyrivibrio sp.]|nr:FtsX-like permease family protein [Butyrivibrio sp.]
ERTREIGIRKSIGASTGAIMTQFLAEAAILTFLGGIVGIILGILAAYVICSAIGFDVIITPTSVLGAAVFSIMIGLFFGIYPARKAATMKPIDALRL